MAIAFVRPVIYHHNEVWTDCVCMLHALWCRFRMHEFVKMMRVYRSSRMRMKWICSKRSTAQHIHSTWTRAYDISVSYDWKSVQIIPSIYTPNPIVINFRWHSSSSSSLLLLMSITIAYHLHTISHAQSVVWIDCSEIIIILNNTTCSRIDHNNNNISILFSSDLGSIGRHDILSHLRISVSITCRCGISQTLPTVQCSHSTHFTCYRYPPREKSSSSSLSFCCLSKRSTWCERQQKADRVRQTNEREVKERKNGESHASEDRERGRETARSYTIKCKMIRKYSNCVYRFQCHYCMINWTTSILLQPLDSLILFFYIK